MRCWLGGLVALGFPVLVAAQGTEPLRKTDLIRLLSNPMIRKGEVADLVRRNCLAFRPTERDWADLRDLGADADVMSSIGGCTARQATRAGGTLASAAMPGAPPTAAASAPAGPGPLTVTLLSARTAVPAASEALIRVGVRRGDAPQRAVTLALRGSSNITGGTGSDAQALTDDSGLAVFRVPAGPAVANHHFQGVLANRAAVPGGAPADLGGGSGRAAGFGEAQAELPLPD